VRGRVAGADPDVVVEDVDPAERVASGSHQCAGRVVATDVAHEHVTAIALGRDRVVRVAHRDLVAVDQQHLGALARERDRSRPAVADRHARRLPGADDDRGPALQPCAHPAMMAPGRAEARR
jgi:hypothetical protein